MNKTILKNRKAAGVRPLPTRGRPRSRPAPLQLLSDPADPTPLYFKLRNLLQEAIQSLEYPPGSRLPPERDMAQLYGVARTTVRQALDALAGEGVIGRRRGRKGGTFVQSPAAVAPAPTAVGPFNVVLSPRQFRKIEVDAFDVRTCNTAIGAALGLPPATPVRYIERRLVGALGPLGFVRNFLPLPIGQRLQRRDLGTRTLYEVLTQKLGIKISEVHDAVEAVLADTRVASRLGARVGTPLLSIRRVYLAAGGEPVNLTILITRADRYKIAVRLQDRDVE